MGIFERMGFPGPIAFGITMVSAALAGMVGLGTYGYLRDKKRWGTWKAGMGAGALAMGVGAAASLATSYLKGTSTAGLSMRRIGMISANKIGLLTAKQVGAMPTVVAGLTAERLKGGCASCGW